ncbi:Alpha-(1,3)-fucosyltransferase C [Orchesella cincta]|uniref:Fucosyltransferase n=1 Tax=Orchesella cincta TaxID=48709 RepID=A0A1D2MVP1_ORCCI|nr:Alpha-(1,3)-fucosyltransferase C [Orchesella cincta]
MESWQGSRVRKKLHILIKITDCNIRFLSYIAHSGQLSIEEMDILIQRGNYESKIAQAKLFYEFLIKKRDSYSVLLEGLKETCQNGAYDVLTNKEPSEMETVREKPLSKENLTYIRNKLPDLSTLTTCSYLLLAKLESLDILNEDDVSILYAERKRLGEHAQSKLLYKMMIKRNHGFYALMEALEETTQTGSLHILKLGNICSENQSDKENLPVDTAVNTFETCNTIGESYDTSLLKNTEATGHEGSSIVYKGNFGKTSMELKKIQSRSSKVCQNELNNWEDIQKTNERGNLHIMKLDCWAERMEGCEKSYYIATERAVCDLKTRIMELKFMKNSNNIYDEEQKKLTRFIHEAAMGLEWLHNDAKINHGNIYPESIFICSGLSGKEIGKVGNYGGSTNLPELTDISSTENNWVSPECLTGTSQNNFAARASQDIFCLGMTVYFTLSMGEHPFKWSEKFKDDIQLNIADKETRPISLTSPDLAANHALKWMMSKNPESRPNITQVVNHPSFWKWEKSIQFLINVARCFDDPNLNSLSEKIDEDYESWTAGISQTVKWTSNISAADLKVLFHFKTYRSELIMKLVQLIRDKFMHYKGLKPIEDKDKNMFWENDIFCDKKFSKYFLDKFPHLVIYLFCTLAKENHTSLGPLDKKYFKIYNNIPDWETLMQWLNVSKKTEFCQDGARYYYQNVNDQKRKQEETTDQSKKKRRWIYALYSSGPTYFSGQNLIWIDEGRTNPLILMWTPYFKERGGDPLQIMQRFPNNTKQMDECFGNCEITFDRKRIKEAHAVIFHAWHSDLKKIDMPKIRSARQLWVLMDQESPMKSRSNLDSFSGVFNWTMTYRRDSDVYHPYGEIIENSEHVTNESNFHLESFLAAKTKLIAGVTSNCDTDSKREVLIEKLRKEGVVIDIFGKCGTPVCPHGKRIGNNCSQEEFWEQLAKDYKFYLAFENALCVDYVTEKFFRTLELGIVPVVYGGADYDLIAPPNSFINVDSFQSPKQLAEFLKNLNENAEEYKKYFEWRIKYKVVKGLGGFNLCKKLTNHILERRKNGGHIPRIYNNIKEWWFQYPENDKENHAEKKDACRKPREWH